MKKIYLFVLLALFFIPVVSFAHPGNTDSSGCHTCRTNCSDWGLSYGEYHCHNAKSSYQPLSPIKSTYGSGGTGYTEYWSDYEYNYPSIPSCTLNSYYDSTSDGCKCNYGYVVDGDSCVSGNSYCWDEYGYNSTYDSLNKTCGCLSGYTFDSDDQCVSYDNYCEDIYGYHSEYSYLSDQCVCESGYVANDSGDSCISADYYCEDLFGDSYYSSITKQCECDYGKVFENGYCVEEKEDIEPVTIYKDIYENNNFSVDNESKTDVSPKNFTPVSNSVFNEVKENKFNFDEDLVELYKTKYNGLFLADGNIRECPDLSCDKIITLKKDSGAVIVGEYSDWFKVGDYNGWVYSGIVEKQSEIIEEKVVESSETDFHVDVEKEKKGFWNRIWSFFF
jgi:hypothetical protein